MSQMKAIALRLTGIQFAQLAKLERKLGLDRSNVIRLAIARLAEQEGIVSAEKR